MPWTAPPTWSVGQVSTASDWNTYVGANTNFLATPPLCQVYCNVAPTLAAGAYTLITYDTVLVDTASGFSVSTHLYTVPVAGTYLVTVTLGISDTSGTAETLTAIFHNGAYAKQAGGVATPAGANTFGIQCTGLVTCAASDTLSGEFFLSSFTGTGVAGQQFTYMDIVKVSN